MRVPFQVKKLVSEGRLFPLIVLLTFFTGKIEKNVTCPDLWAAIK
jgi:hypothetical protein